MEHLLQIIEQLALQRRALMQRTYEVKPDKRFWKIAVLVEDNVVNRYMEVNKLHWVDNIDFGLLRGMQEHVIETLTENY